MTGDRKKIAVIIQGFTQGGAVASACLNQARTLSRIYDVTILSDTGPLVENRLNHHLAIEPVPVISLRFLRRYSHVPAQFVFILSAGLRLIAQATRLRYDAVIFHSHPPAALLAPLLRRWTGCRCVMVMHGDIFDRPRGTYDHRITAWYQCTTRPAYRRVDAVLALSHYMRDFAIRGGTPPDSVYLVPNGINAAEIGLGETPPRSGATFTPVGAAPCDLLFIGRLEPNKGIDLLISACVQLLTSHPNLRVTAIGTCTPAYRPALLGLLQASGLADHLRILNHVDRHHLGEHYRQCRAVVVPSRSETQSTVILEAMAAGRAVVASDTGGNPMMVQQEITGLLFANGSVRELVEALGQIVSKPGRAEAMGEAARRRQQQCFSLERSAEQLLTSFAEILSPDFRRVRP